MSTVALFFVSFFCYYVCGQTNHCINELRHITKPTYLNLSNPSGIKPNYSSISSVAYHQQTSTLLFGGDFFYIDAKNTKNRTYYQYFQAFNHTKDNKFEVKYSFNISFNNPSFGNQLISHESLRSWTRIIAHPSLQYVFLLGINNLTAYNVTDGAHLWTAQISPCADHPKNTNNPDRPLIYNDATFFKEDNDNIYVGGTCVSTWNKTVIVLDKYNVKTGAFDKTFRLQYNLTEVGFFDLESHPKIADILDGAGFIPPEVTIKAPVGISLNTSIEDKYFYVGFTHLMFSGLCRVEYDKFSADWRIKKWPDHWTLVNPSFVSHRNLVTTNDGLISLLDPGINGLLSLFYGHMKHLMGWQTKKELGQIDEKEIFNKSTWYAGHEKYDLHLDWTLNIDPLSNYQHIYVTTAPLQFTTNTTNFRNSTIAKHDVTLGELKAGAHVPFYAIDSIVTNDGQLVTVGFEWTPSIKIGLPMNFSLSGILPYLERKAVFQVFNNTEIEGTCAGCKVDYYSNSSLGEDGLCINKCQCENGYCNDDLKGDGSCYCTITSYGKTCKECDGFNFGPDGRSCDPLRGICNSGPDGDGTCKFCYNIELNNLIPPNISVGMDMYGPECNDECTCDGDHGICYTTGNVEAPRAGECLYCTDPNYYGTNCDLKCDCDSNKGYCDHGIHGKGCVDFDYGGLFKNIGWQIYTTIGTCLWIFFFTITFWQSNKQHKKNTGKPLPWCPKKEKSDNNNDNDNDDKDNNDLNEKMLNANMNGNGYNRQQQDDNYLLDEDSNEPPAISHMINDGNGVIEQEQNDEPQRYDI